MDRAALHAICETFAPGANAAPHVAAAVERQLGRAERLQLAALLRLWRPGFARLPQERREEILRGWADSRLVARRSAYVALKTAALSYAYMLRSGRWDEIGYAGPPGPPAEPPPRRLAPLEIGRDTDLSCDVCVVGSGAGGGVAAAVLAQAGLDVVVLEAGGYFAEADFDGAEHPGYDRLYVAGAAAATDDRGVGLLAGACLGGGTVVNYTTSFRTPDDVRAEWQALGFPAGEEFGRSLDAVCERLAVNTEHNRPSGRDIVLGRGLERLGWHRDLLPRNVVGCEQGRICGSCGLGCPLGAKRSTLLTWLEDAAAAGAQIVVDAPAVRVLVAGGAASGVEARTRRGHRLLVRARAVVAAAGALGTPPLLLRSGLTSPHVGRWLRLHPGTPVFGVFDDDVVPWEGTLQTLYSDELASLEGGYGVRFETVPILPAHAAVALPWRSAAQHAGAMREFRRTGHVGVLVRDRGAGSVSVRRDGSTRVSYRLSADDLRLVRAGVDGAAQVLEAAGARRIFTTHSRPVSYEPGREGDRARLLRDADAAGWGPGRCGFFSFHQLGSARMGASPETSAAGPEGETWEVRNLVVADASGFPTASGVNPMVTVSALAHQNARALAARLT